MTCVVWVHVLIDWLLVGCGCVKVGVGVGEPPTSHCVTCVPTYIVCSIVELGGVCEVRQEMGQQREKLLMEMGLLKTELLGKCDTCVGVNVYVDVYTSTVQDTINFQF